MKNKQKPCHVLEFAKQMVGDGTQEHFQDAKACEEWFNTIATRLVKEGWIEDKKESKNLAHTSFTVADWLKCKQCYSITKELAQDLFTMEDLSFPVNSLHLPFPTIYLELEGIEEKTRNGADPLGVFITVSEVPYGDLTACMCSIVTLFWNGKEYVFGGISFDYDPSHMDQSLKETIDMLTADFSDEKAYLIEAMLFAAYLSAEKPDIVENETQKKIYRPSGKIKYSSIRKWDVGIRYTAERLREQNNEGHNGHLVNGRHPPRPHLRRAHWQVYRIGPGRKEKKVLWIPPVMVGMQKDREIPAVVHKYGGKSEAKQER